MHCVLVLMFTCQNISFYLSSCAVSASLKYLASLFQKLSRRFFMTETESDLNPTHILNVESVTIQCYRHSRNTVKWPPGHAT